MSRTELFLSCVFVPPSVGLADSAVNGHAAFEVNIRLAGKHSLMLTWHDTAPKAALKVELEKLSMYDKSEESPFAADPDVKRTDVDELVDRLLFVALDDKPDKPRLTSVLGSAVREWRENRHLTRRDFARQLRVSAGWLAAFENGCVTADALDAARIEDMAQTLEIEPLALELLAELDENALWEEVNQLWEQELRRQERKCSYHP